LLWGGIVSGNFIIPGNKRCQSCSRYRSTSIKDALKLCFFASLVRVMAVLLEFTGKIIGFALASRALTAQAADRAMV
jgi:ribosomal protein S14